MAKTAQRYIEWDGRQIDLDLDRSKLTMDEAMEVERLAGIPFFSVTGQHLPMPIWAAMVFVELRRTDPKVKYSDVRKLATGAVGARVVDDGEPDADPDAEAAPDPTGGEVSSSEPSPSAEPTTSDLSLTS